MHACMHAWMDSNEESDMIYDPYFACFVDIHANKNQMEMKNKNASSNHACMHGLNATKELKKERKKEIERYIEIKRTKMRELLQLGSALEDEERLEAWP